jgi:hypothetical protein
MTGESYQPRICIYEKWKVNFAKSEKFGTTQRYKASKIIIYIYSGI